ARNAELLHGAHAAAGPRVQRTCPTRGGGTSLRLRAVGSPAFRAQVGASSSRGHVLRRFRRESRGSASRWRGPQVVREGTEEDRGSRGESQKGGCMTLIVILPTIKMSVLIGVVLARVPLLRKRSAALRHSVLVATV